MRPLFSYRALDGNPGHPVWSPLSMRPTRRKGAGVKPERGLVNEERGEGGCSGKFIRRRTHVIHHGWPWSYDHR